MAAVADRQEPWSPPAHLGALLGADGSCSFRVWAPAAGRVELQLEEPARRVPMTREPRGYHQASVAGCAVGTRYRFVLDGSALPDPASRWQPDGVHGASAIAPPDFDWHDRHWRGLPLEDYVIYELHVGTFTPEGTFDAACERLDDLRELGITAVELLPIAEFPGSRNWGYDGVSPFAAHSSYGGPQGLRRFVDAAHRAGIAVVLDVVYNHVGPEGNYLSRFGPYFTARYRTPWGDAINYDGEHSDEVRAFFIASALQWIEDFHVDALRLDAVHAIFDASAYPFLRELAEAVRERGRTLGREVILFAESDLGDPRMITSGERGGMHMHAQWLDDFHHALHALVTGERQGYYADFGELEHLARAFERGYVYAGEFSRFRKRRHGWPARQVRPEQFVVFAQNHDQVGNRLAGDRLSAQLSQEQLRLVAATVLLSPYIPLLFMGEEYGERAPFPYFVSHGDPGLADAVRRGRREEFAAFGWQQEPPDPQAEETCSQAVLRWNTREDGEHRELLELHRELLRVRREQRGVLMGHDQLVTRFGPDAGGPGMLQVHRTGPHGEAILLLNFAGESARAPLPSGRWRALIHTAGATGGQTERERAMPPFSATLLLRESE